MKLSVANLVVGLVIVAVGVAGGGLLMSYSEADDAPGGVLLGILLMAGAVALGVRTARRKT